LETGPAGPVSFPGFGAVIVQFVQDCLTTAANNGAVPRLSNIGIIGSGTAGRILGAAFAERGHRVCLGTRDPAKLASWAKSVGSRAHVGSAADAARFGDVIILSVLGTAMQSVIETAGADAFGDKIVVDASDPLDFSGDRPALFVGCTDSLGERVQRLLPRARVVKALQQVLAEVMVNPALTGGEPDMFIAGNDEKAKAIVGELIRGFGWKRIIDLGDIQNARWLETLSFLWLVYSHRTGKVFHAFKVLNG
jgi:predicted dinucleotide-binding enzyme